MIIVGEKSRSQGVRMLSAERSWLPFSGDNGFHPAVYSPKPVRPREVTQSQTPGYYNYSIFYFEKFQVLGMIIIKYKCFLTRL